MNASLLTMLTSSIVAAIVMAGICAVIQAVVKVRTHRRLTRLHRELEEARQAHVTAMQELHQRQLWLCDELGLPEPPLPDVLRPAAETGPETRRRIRVPLNLPFRGGGSLLNRAPRGSSAFIVGRYGASFAASTVWKTSSGNILRLASPVTARFMAFAPRVVGVAPRFAAAGGGATGSIAASTGVRFALGAISIVGLVIGPVLTAWSVYRELRKLRRARDEFAESMVQFDSELAAMTSRTAELEEQLAAEPSAESRRSDLDKSGSPVLQPVNVEGS